MDPFEGYATGLNTVASHAVLVTPDDNNDLAVFPLAFHCGVVGTVKVTTVGGETLVIPSTVVDLSNGIVCIRVRRIWATDTTASDIVAVW